MASVSRAPAGTGTETPESIDVYRLSPHGRPTLVLMWDGNGYTRDTCWLQIDADAACDLDSYL